MVKRYGKRVRIIGIAGLALFLALAGRLYYIQVLCGQELAAGALGQQIIKVQSVNNRGTIYDRNMIPLTDSGCSYYYLVEEEKCDAGFDLLMKRVQAEEAGAKGGGYKVYKTDVYDEEVNETLLTRYRAYGFCLGSRYEDEQIAAHLIGYVSGEEKTGAAGLEKMFQYRLSASSAKLLMMGSGIGAPISGIGVRKAENRTIIDPAAVVTTIDSSLQRKIEEILDRENISGAVVVMKPGSGQILAMASAPDFNPNQVEDYLNSEQGELVNKAVQGIYPPGSVFKIVVAAAALESGAADLTQTYHCTGKTEINGVTLICDDHPDGHGEVDFEDAFALSCNGFFAHLAEKTGSETIVEMAQRMGFGKAVIAGFPDEEAGAFPEENERSDKGLSNFAIGQGSLLVTPMQIAKMTNIIASGGVDYGASLIMGKESQSSGGIRVMTEVTAKEIAAMMEAVCERGTASGAGLHRRAAGKTGSAEAGTGESYTVHGWFTGFFPAEDPEYTVTVIVENGKTGSRSALPVFEEIVNFLY